MEERSKRRKTISKDKRKLVYEKCDGHCAYCGRQLEYKDMQVDHLHPVYLGGKDELENYMPACRACNFYKSTMSIEDLREQIGLLQKRLNNIFIYKLALSYGVIEETSKEIKFYFEELPVTMGYKR